MFSANQYLDFAWLSMQMFLINLLKDKIMRYAVTYCAMDHEFSGNPFWHSCILLSQWDDNGKIEVVDNWGFYGVPSTVRDTWLSKLKIKLGLDVDLKGNHGMLRHEELRYLDVGYGLHGVTFELTREKFDLLQLKCKTMLEEQKQAVKEVVESQGIAGKQKYRIYEHEDYSPLIFALEKIKAKQKGHKPRLKPFELNLSFTLWGPALNQSYTCKSLMVDLLKGILSQEQIARITEEGKHPTVPRYSGKLERIYLHSSGPLREHKKSSGAIVHYRDLQDEGVKLHWTLPPQEIEALSGDTIKLLEISEEYCDEVKQAISKLQKLEWLFIDAKLPEKYQSYQEDLIVRIRQCYEAFAEVEPKKAKSTATGWMGFALSLFSLPRDLDEKTLLQKLNNAKYLINSLYMAIVDHWKIYDDWPSETKTDSTDYNPLEALAAYLCEDDKKKLCKIIGRNYLDPSSEEEFDDIEEIKWGQPELRGTAASPM
ncbi:TPA: lpg2160 family Dot/Icm T4SS effector [Legionella pneumophila]|nr:lpg2160 family Dot/Icm T4SS effector [Legionella pneumophila]HAU1320001.1 lpg2160 family Dot/Icm T4SS effector [Legionella pneumophila]HBC0467683.1 lpg2160 family Dot/Icm T4SS effector [Legionella pneumophila]HBD9373172.1 lpg2160 family Dot/Icm T4SS effector [Legionella pneumophila]HBI2945625.1 lpg2160 family Dot/Icm T4SS effector [Legionella pneumophila]